MKGEGTKTERGRDGQKKRTNANRETKNESENDTVASFFVWGSGSELAYHCVELGVVKR
jgi:hypothetical protein